MEESFEALKSAYLSYVDGYRDGGGRLPDMMQLKLVHTMMVTDAARRIAVVTLPARAEGVFKVN